MEIAYKGMNNAASDYAVGDGALEVSHGLISEGGGLRPIEQPLPDASYPAGNIIYIHKGNGYRHYVIDSGGLEVRDGDSRPIEGLGEVAGSVTDINSVGNVLIIVTEDDVYYYLWDAALERYRFLGTHLPEVALTFGLHGVTPQGSTMTEIEQDLKIKYMIGGSVPYMEEEDRKTLNEFSWALLNRYTAESQEKDGVFFQPFFVRYAIRMYDGSLTMHSAPVLMMPTNNVPYMYGVVGDESNIKYIHLTWQPYVLDYALIDEKMKEALQDWGDLIRSVDVFVSAPIDLLDRKEDSLVTVRSRNKGTHIWKTVSLDDARLAGDRIYSYRTIENEGPGILNPEFEIRVPMKDAGIIRQAIEDTGSFYMLKSIPVDELSTSRVNLNPGGEYMQSLVNREQMTDDYDSHDTIIPRYTFSYNNRLNMANLKKRLFEGYHTGSTIPYTGPLKPEDASEQWRAEIDVFVFIKQDGREITVKAPGGVYYSGCEAPLFYYYYPNPNAYKAVVTTRKPDGTEETCELTLRRHEFLNGAYYFSSLNKTAFEQMRDPDKDEGGDLVGGGSTGGGGSRPGYNEMPPLSGRGELTVEMPNTIYTSEADNPFCFPASGINSLNAGEIHGIKSAARPLSTGQFGQFPLYAFTDEGVWALEQNAAGIYTAKQPITREVCINPAGITQLDRAVAFPTERGIMVLSGSEVNCITEPIFNPYGESPNTMLQALRGNHRDMYAEALRVLDPDYLRRAQMLYDYRHQRITVFRPDEGETRPAFVYSIKGSSWGTMDATIVRALNSYPEALAVIRTADGLRTADFSADDRGELTAAGSKISGWMLTRPMKLGTPDRLKTLRMVKQTGTHDIYSVRSILFGSRDLRSWVPVWSSYTSEMRGFGGSGYRHFRVMLICDMESGESISGMHIYGQ